MGEGGAPADPCGGRPICCRLPAASAPPPSAASGLRCRFPCGDVPASVCGTAVCCTPPPQVDPEDLSSACFAVLDGDDAVVFASPTWRADADAGAGAAAACCARPAGAPHGAGGAAEPADGAAADGGKDFGRRANESRGDFLRREYSALKPFVIISLSYLLFTTTDGAVRMIVLLHAYNLGFSALQTAIMFSLYELAGVVTNLAAGLMGARWGIKSTLLTGLTLQLVGIGMLFGWRSSWAAHGEVAKAIVFVTAAQMLCGVAKDLTKLGGKTVTKLVTPDEKQSRLFKVVSFITGWKNSLKGFGYFLGAACLTFNYYFALSVLLVLVAAAMPWAVVGLSNQLGRARKENVRLSAILRQRYNVNVLSAARLFLFGSRDLWFEVPLPFFLRDAVYGMGWQRVAVGATLASFVILYGQVQSWTPQLVLQPLRQSPANKYVELLWNGLLAFAPAVMAVLLLGTPVYSGRHLAAMQGTMVAGLLLYCVLFAVNSSVHSYLIVRYAEGDKVAMNVGFYYMANAAGRLVGTMASGALYTFAGHTPVEGLGWCFVGSVAFAAISTAITALLRDDAGGLRCGPCLTLVKGRTARTLLPAPAGGAAPLVSQPPPPTAAPGAPPASGASARLLGASAAAAAVTAGGASAAAAAAAAAAVPSSTDGGGLSGVVCQLLDPKLDVLSLPASALAGKRVLYRADLNLPLQGAGPGARVADDTRLAEVLPTLRELAARGARVVLCSHLGRPDPGKQSAEEMRRRYSLAPVAALLARELGAGTFAGQLPDCVGPAVERGVAAMSDGQVVLLENLRFHAAEAANDAAFAVRLAALADIYVGDAFGTAHRDQASITGVLAHFAAGSAFPGPLLRRELRHLHGACTSPQRPFCVVIGGAKVADKLPVLQRLIEDADVVLIGGRMAFTFLAAEGVPVGSTQIEPGWLQSCSAMVAAARARGVRLLLPEDAVVARSLDDDHGCCTVPLVPGCCTDDAPCVPHGCFGLDIGPRTAAAFAEAIQGCRTIFWNGPMGRFEVPGFAAGTEAVARAMGQATAATGAVTVAGGGDSVSAIKHLRPPVELSFLSTGGGAGLELVEGRVLPGLAVLAAAAARAPASAGDARARGSSH